MREDIIAHSARRDQRGEVAGRKVPGLGVAYCSTLKRTGLIRTVLPTWTEML